MQNTGSVAWQDQLVKHSMSQSLIKTHNQQLHPLKNKVDSARIKQTYPIISSPA